MNAGAKKKDHKADYDKSFTGYFPRGEGAVSAVTGGSPEDLNAMPATEEPEREGPIYDGSQVKVIPFKAGIK